MKKLKDVEYVGWGFFGIVSIVTIPIGLFIMFKFTYAANINMAVRIGVGAFIGLVLSAFVSFIVNDFFYRRTKKKYLEERKQARKSKKNKKKKKKK